MICRGSPYVTAAVIIDIDTVLRRATYHATNVSACHLSPYTIPWRNTKMETQTGPAQRLDLGNKLGTDTLDNGFLTPARC